MARLSQLFPSDRPRDVVIDYAFDPAWMAASRDYGAASEVQLRYDCFLGDVVLLIGSHDLSARWGWIPVLDFAAALSDAVKELKDARESCIEFTENESIIRLTRSDDCIVIAPTYIDDSVKASWWSFVEATRYMNAKLLLELEHAYPELLLNTSYAKLKNVLIL